MSHLDPDQLALLAMGESVSSHADDEHLATCELCHHELRELSHAATLARATIGESAPETPPARVWARISDELGLSADGLVASATPDAEPSPPATDEPPAADAPPSSPVTPVPARRRGRWIWALAASVALVLAVGVTWGTFAVLRPTQIAAASLAAFPSHPDASGTADVEELRDGTLRLRVSLDANVEEGAYREVWLIRNDAGALISLGVLDGSEGTFAIPQGVDLAQYSLVDVSFEPLNGDPAHSGDSIVRGELSFA